MVWSCWLARDRCAEDDHAEDAVVLLIPLRQFHDRIARPPLIHSPAPTGPY
jgi:hypothetical protein